MSRRAFRKLRNRVILTLAMALAIGVFATPAQAALPIGGLPQAIGAYVATPGHAAGANDWNCRPSAARPTPVILLHGTLVNTGANWVALSPMLKNAGYCVYALNYGMTWLSAGRIGGLDHVANSAKQLAAFVDRVRASTGSAKVDIVGHSQGGMMPNYYIKRLGGASKVRTLVGIAPSNHGIAPGGSSALASKLGILGPIFRNAVDAAMRFAMPGRVEQESGSAFQRALFADGDTVPGPRYAVIASNKDTTVAPYTNAFLSGPNVTNILIQDQCPDNKVSHIGLFLDSPTLQNVLNQLGPNSAGFKATCTGYGPTF